MSATSNDEVFDEAVQCLKDGLMWMAQAKDGASQGRDARAQRGNRFLDDPRMATTQALEYLFDNVAIPLTKNSATKELRSKWCARLVDSGLVNILFGCLPDRDAFERSKRDMGEIKRILDGFQEFLSYLQVALEENVSVVEDDDELVAGLFNISRRSAALDPGSLDHHHRYQLWQNHLRVLAWEKRQISQSDYMRHTLDLLDYLQWEVQGRKDVSCRVQKPWKFSTPEELNQSAPSDLSRVIPDDSYSACADCATPGATLRCVSCHPSEDHRTVAGIAYCSETCLKKHSGAHAASCKEIRDLARCTRLFQVAFNLYLLSTDGDMDFTVAKRYGVVTKWQMRKPKRSDSTAGRDPLRLDLRDLNEAAGLHFQCCTAIKQSAQVLLEYFIRQFRNFCPKNAEITVICNGFSNISMAHTVGLLTTQSELQFAFDPTAAQFGWHENLAPWEHYRRRRVDTEYTVDACEPLRMQRDRTKHTQMPADPALQQHWKCKCVAEEIVGIADDLFAKVGLRHILDAPDSDFRRYLATFKEDLEQFIGSSDFLRDLYKPDVTKEEPLNM